MIQSIARAAEILETIAHAGGRSHLNDIAETTGLKVTTVHNILKTLHELGYVKRRVGDRRYHLGDRILNLARVAGNDGALHRELRPILEKIAEQIGETVFLAVPSGDEVYFLDAIESLHTLKAASQEGDREPMEGSAIGLLFLAYIPALRKRMLTTHASRIGPGIQNEIDVIAERGYAQDLENWQPGLNCIAIPWFDDGEIRAGFGLAGPSCRLPPARLRDYADVMRQLIDAGRFKSTE